MFVGLVESPRDLFQQSLDPLIGSCLIDHQPQGTRKLKRLDGHHQPHLRFIIELEAYKLGCYLFQSTDYPRLDPIRFLFSPSGQSHQTLHDYLLSWGLDCQVSDHESELFDQICHPVSEQIASCLDDVERYRQRFSTIHLLQACLTLVSELYPEVPFKSSLSTPSTDPERDNPSAAPVEHKEHTTGEFEQGDSEEPDDEFRAENLCEKLSSPPPLTSPSDPHGPSASQSGSNASVNICESDLAALLEADSQNLNHNQGIICKKLIESINNPNDFQLSPPITSNVPIEANHSPGGLFEPLNVTPRRALLPIKNHRFCFNEPQDSAIRIQFDSQSQKTRPQDQPNSTEESLINPPGDRLSAMSDPVIPQSPPVLDAPIQLEVNKSQSEQIELVHHSSTTFESHSSPNHSNLAPHPISNQHQAEPCLLELSHDPPAETLRMIEFQPAFKPSRKLKTQRCLLSAPPRPFLESESEDEGSESQNLAQLHRHPDSPPVRGGPITNRRYRDSRSHLPERQPAGKDHVSKTQRAHTVDPDRLLNHTSTKHRDITNHPTSPGLIDARRGSPGESDDSEPVGGRPNRRRARTKRRSEATDDSSSYDSPIPKRKRKRRRSTSSDRAPRRLGRTVWTKEEEDLLIEEVEKRYRQKTCMAKIIKRHGPQGNVSRTFAHRTSVQLKDKAINLSTKWYREGTQLSETRREAFSRFPPKRKKYVLSNDGSASYDSSPIDELSSDPGN